MESPGIPGRFTYARVRCRHPLARASQHYRHYSVVQIDELVTALDLIADEHGRGNKTLQMLQLEAKKQVVA
jgi:hypothetical protein